MADYQNLIFASDTAFDDNWFYAKYYFSGSNYRYRTFQLTLNLLNQLRVNPLIVETGCQRFPDDIGAGCSTSIFGEYIHRYGGELYVIDLDPNNIEVCKEVTKEWSAKTTYIVSDSISFLSGFKEPIDLLYLDSYDYPLNPYEEPVLAKASQDHCVEEFKAAARSKCLTDKTILLIDDNQLPGGGKPKKLKEYLVANKWKCLLDFQQSLWVKKLGL